MEAAVVHFRQGRHHVHPKQVILKVADSPEEGKEIKGKVSALHGRTGSVRVIFSEAGLPGQALGQKVKIE